MTSPDVPDPGKTNDEDEDALALHINALCHDDQRRARHGERVCVHAEARVDGHLLHEFDEKT